MTAQSFWCYDKQWERSHLSARPNNGFKITYKQPQTLQPTPRWTLFQTPFVVLDFCGSSNREQIEHQRLTSECCSSMGIVQIYSTAQMKENRDKTEHTHKIENGCLQFLQSDVEKWQTGAQCQLVHPLPNITVWVCHVCYWQLSSPTCF